MAPEIHTNNREAVPQPQVPEYDFVREREKVRAMLLIPEDQAASWESISKEIASSLPHPDEAAPHVLIRDELQRRYELLSSRRIAAGRALDAVYELHKAGQSLDERGMNTALRIVAQFIDQKDEYVHLLQGKVSSGTPLPNYLAKYSPTRQLDSLAARVTSRLLPMQYDVAEKANLAVSPKKLSDAANEIATTAVRLRLKMDTVLLCMKNGVATDDMAAYDRLLSEAGFDKKGAKEWNKETIEGARFLVTYIGKYKDSIEEYAKMYTGGDVGKMTVADALECCAQNSAIAELLERVASDARNILQTDPDITGFTKDLFDSKFDVPGRAAELMLAPLAKLTGTPESQEVFQRDAQKVVGFFRSSEAASISVGVVDSQFHDLNDAQKKMILAVCDKITGQGSAAMIKRLQDATFISSNPDESVNAEITAVLTDLIQNNKIKAKDAFELFYLSESKGGKIMLAYKAVSLLASNNRQDLANALQMRLLRRLTDLAMDKAGGIDGIAEEMNLSPEEKAEMLNVQKYLKESGMDAIGNWMDKLWNWCANYPELAIGAGILSGAVGFGVRTTLKASRTLNISRMQQFNRMSVEEIRRSHPGLANIPDEQISLAKREVNKLVTELSLMGERWNLPFAKGGVIKSANLFVRAATDPELKSMAKALRRVYPNVLDAASELYEVAGDKESLRKALVDSGYDAAQTDAAVDQVIQNRMRDGKPVRAEVVVDKPLSALERARQREGGNLTGGAGSQANVAANTAKVSPDTAAKPTTETSEPDQKKKGFGESVSDFLRKRFGKK